MISFIPALLSSQYTSLSTRIFKGIGLKFIFSYRSGSNVSGQGVRVLPIWPKDSAILYASSVIILFAKDPWVHLLKQSKSQRMTETNKLVRRVIQSCLKAKVVIAVPNGHSHRQWETLHQRGVRYGNCSNGIKMHTFEQSLLRYSFCLTWLYTQKSEGSSCAKDEKKRAWKRSASLSSTWLRKLSVLFGSVGLQ